MNDKLFNLFMAVINAAKEGRYMFGNGADWYIVENNTKYHVNTVDGTKTEVADYVGTPRFDQGVANNIEEMLLFTPGEVTESQWDRHMAKAMLATAIRANEVLATDGGNWYFINGAAVVVVALGDKSQKVTVQVMDQLGSWRFIKSRNGYRLQLSDDTKRQMGVCV